MSPQKSSRANRKKGGGKSSSVGGLSPWETRLFGRLTDSLGVGFGLTDLSGKIHYANSTFKHTLGIHDALLTEKPLQNYISRFGHWDFEAALAHAQMDVVQGTFEILNGNGDLRTIQATLSGAHHEDNDTIWMLTHEVTELLKTGKALHDSEDSLHLLSGRLMKAQDIERRRMARDLHDTTGQELAVILMSLTQLFKGLGTPGYEAKPVIEDAIALVRRVENEIRTLSYVLHPPLLDDLGLNSALNWYVEGFVKRSKIEVDLNIPPTMPRLSRDKEIAIFRVVQECLTNVLRHSGSSTARIDAEARDGFLRLFVEDSGKGFSASPERSAKQDKVTLGVGILGMRERLQQLGGFLSIDSTPAGTKISAGVPLGVEGEAAAGQFQFEEGNDPATGQGHPEAAGQEPLTRRRILIADDHELMRRGIRNLLVEEKDLEVCGEATDGLDTVAKASQLHPDLVILDLSMPKLGGFSAAQIIHEQNPATKILVFTNHSYEQVQGLIRNVGCEGFVSKARAGTDLIRGVRTVLGGQKFYESGLSRAAHPA